MAVNEDYIKQCQDEYNRSKAAGDTAGMAAAHILAEEERAKNGYSGGADGSDYISIGKTGSNPQLQGPTSQQSGINGIYDAQRDSRLAALKSAYDQNVLDLDNTAAKIPETYNTARNSAAATSAISQAQFNEQAAASGLNSGAGGQAALAYGNNLASNLSSIDQKQADAITDINNQRQKYAAAYNDAIAQAIADNDSARAQALYNEAVRVDNGLVQTAYQQAQLDQNQKQLDQNQNQFDKTYDLQKQEQQISLNKYSDEQAYNKAKLLAASGDFSGFQSLFNLSDELTAYLKRVYAAENPKTAWVVNG